MVDDHVVSAPGDLDPEQLARAIVTRPEVCIGVPPTAQVVRAFISGCAICQPRTSEGARR